MSNNQICSVHDREVCTLWCPAVMEKYLCTPPHHFMCPITLELMHHPVTDEYGFTFEREALLENLQHLNYLCPTTGERYTWIHLQTRLAVSQTIKHCMLEWWLNWYYSLKPFHVQPAEFKVPKRRLQEASKKYQERLLSETRILHRRSLAVDLRTPTPSEVVRIDSTDTETDSDFELEN